MASCLNCDIWAWIDSLPPPSQWRKDSMAISICSSDSSLATLNVTVAKIPSSTSIFFSMNAKFSLPVSLWTSKYLQIQSNSSKLLDEEAVYNLLQNCIQDVLKYGPSKNIYVPRIPKINSTTSLKCIFNLSFLTLAYLICIYEAPEDIRYNCLHALMDQLTTTQSREGAKVLMRLLGSNTEEQWMRSLNLAITNWNLERRAANRQLNAPSPLFSHAHSTFGLWKVQLYCPIIAMEVENSSGSTDGQLQFSLNYHQLEGVIQFNYKIIIQDKWADVQLSIDNIRLDVVGLLNETYMNQRGAGESEKHFPSRISLQLTPTPQTDILSVSVSKSSENPKREIEVERSMEGSFQPSNPYLGFKVSAGEAVTSVLKPWKFEESARGDSGNLNWFLHDSGSGREVFSSRPSMAALFQPKAWFRNRYTSAYRPFTRQGGVVFAGDEYGESVCWKVDKCAIGKRMEWEIKGCIWLTYWPNRYKTFYNETRRAEFRETLCLTVA
ncbi:hypothetical protein Nepgr_032383 [Nepenthes gracilis]|uniref:Uncharacterized protein n=1 Tax=Nepenthes gracilis TaxID=150966 RepID=A0AAD3Y7M5_NEPGR|nr:hypothetical protein Nepgr_032383 [Nepenthes gracilis]